MIVLTGRFVNIASANSLVASRFKSAYVTAERGLIGLKKAAVLEAAAPFVAARARVASSLELAGQELRLLGKRSTS